MTIGAIGKQGLGPTFGMAPRAGYRRVPADQRVPSFRMIERGPLDQQPPLGDMALTAIGTQGTGVGIGVAIGAGSVGLGGENQRRRL